MSGVDRDTHHQIEQLLFKEARLLDNRQFEEWLELWTMDCRYVVPVRRNVAAKIGEGLIAVEEELEKEDGAFWIEDDKMQMFARTMRLKTGKAWCENPPSRSRRYVSNIETETTEDTHILKVYSNMLQFRSRREREESWFSAQRTDLVQKSDSGLLLKDRKVVLDSTVMNAPYATFI